MKSPSTAKRKSQPRAVGPIRAPARSDRHALALATAARAPAIKRVSLTDTVREEILRRILNGTIEPGHRIIEMRIAQELGTSQAPVREALRALEVLGVIESSRNRGARVRMLDARELADITDLRAELEGYAASRTAANLGGDTSVLEKHVIAMQRAAKARNVHRFAEANTRFHRTIVEATGNGTLLGVWTQLDVKAHTIMNVLRGHRNLVAVADSHWPIVAALKTGDGRAAKRAIRAHILALRLET
jgi:DNA-binding GntR family transcriptional regulator